MKKSLYLLNELLEEADTSRDNIELWEREKLIRADGITSDKIPFYTKNTLDKIRYIKKLQELGYRLDDIQKIIKKVGLPGSGAQAAKGVKPGRFLTVGGLAEKVGVSSRAIKHWEDKGIIEPDMRSEGGFRLYSDGYVYLCQLIKDLQLFGYSLEEIKTISDLFREFLTIKSDLEPGAPEDRILRLEEMLAQTKVLNNKMNQFKAGIERWEELLKKKKKEISSLINQGKKQCSNKGKQNE